MQLAARCNGIDYLMMEVRGAKDLWSEGRPPPKVKGIPRFFWWNEDGTIDWWPDEDASCKVKWIDHQPQVTGERTT